MVLLGILILIFSAILHEVMHGWVANRLGDPTARIMGRLTLNPIVHIDPLMSILVPLILVVSGSPIIFGAAKPVPVNPHNLRDGRKDLALVALSGPLTNLTIAVVASILAHALSGTEILSSFFFMVTFYNLVLAFVNLIPIPPLDGSKVFSFLLPSDLARSYLSIERYGIFLLFFLLAFPLGGFSLGNLLHALVLQTLRVLGF